MQIDTKDIFQSKITFEQFFHENYGPLCRFAFQFLKDKDETEDVVQQLFVKVWEGRNSLKISTSWKAYLYASVKNLCFNKIKHKQVVDEYESHIKYTESYETVSEDEIEASEMQQKISEVIDQMPEQRKKVFTLSRFEGYKYREIAEELNISVKTVENHMGSAMKYLRKELKDFMHLSVVISFFHAIGENLF